MAGLREKEEGWVGRGGEGMGVMEDRTKNERE